MSRTHPPSLVTLTARTLESGRLVARDAVVLVAVSGGPDSMALLHVLAGLRSGPRSRHGFTLAAHGVDHGLRAAAAAELDVAADFARALDVPFTRSALHVPPGSNLQARARAARYDALEAAMRSTGAARIATAHHATDRAETVLLRLLRGAGPAGLAVLPPRAGDRIRPFIRAESAAIRAHVDRHRIPFADDPSNADPRFARTRVRHEVLPLLRALSPAIDAHLCALADQLLAYHATSPCETDADAPDPTAPGAADGDGQTRALARGTRGALLELSRLASEKRRVLLPGGLVATYDRTQLQVVVQRGSKRPPASPRSDANADAATQSAAARPERFEPDD